MRRFQATLLPKLTTKTKNAKRNAELILPYVCLLLPTIAKPKKFDSVSSYPHQDTPSWGGLGIGEGNLLRCAA